MKHLANSITVSRIIGALLLLFLPYHSAAWIVLYLFCGLSDMADGIAARKTGSADDRGALLDSIADTEFFVICLIRILPNAGFGRWIWCFIIGIACLKTATVLTALFRHLRPLMPHTAANRLTGLLLFLLPFFIRFAEPAPAAIPVCAIAAFAAVQEHLYIRHKA